MPGHEPGKICLHDHVFPHLKDPRPSPSADSYRALAPCHDDGRRSLSVSVGDNGRVVWYCHAGCASDKTRNALIVAGVRPECLPRPVPDRRNLEDAIREIALGADSHAHARLRIAGLLAGYDRLPRGDALEALAESCGVSMREAYKARQGENR